MNEIKGVNVKYDVKLKYFNTYKIESEAKYLINVETIDGLINILKYLKESNIEYFILVAGSNIILDNYFNGAIIKLSGLDYVTIDKNILVAGAGTMMGKISQSALNNSLTGLEWAINIPGTLGGSINGNAGAYNSEIFDNLISIKVLTEDLEVKEMKKEEFVVSYRHTNIKDLNLIVLEGKFKLSKGNQEEAKELIKNRCERRLESQPLDKPSAGSVFRNPEGDHAGRLIEAAGLKGKRIGGAEISLKHANFIVNVGGATSNDIKNLIKLVKDEVKKQFNVDLILEQEIIDWE